MKVGDIVDYKGKKLNIVENKEIGGCEKCYFWLLGCIRPFNFDCIVTDNGNLKDIIFKQVK